LKVIPAIALCKAGYGDCHYNSPFYSIVRSRIAVLSCTYST